MKMKKVLALVLAGLMTASLAACGSEEAPADTAADTATETPAATDDAAEVSDAADDLSGHLTIWTWAEDLKTKGEKFTEKHPNVEIETVIIATADYPTKIEAALGAGDDTIDIFGGEPQMLPAFMQAGFFEDLDAYGFQDYADSLFDYVNLVGQYEGTQYAIGYQTTPAAFYYRRSVANAVWGTDDPAVISEKFSSYANILAAAEECKAKGYRIFASDSELNYFTGQVAWVEDDTLQLSEKRIEYMDLVVELYKQDLVCYAAQWATPWYQAMNGPVAVLTSDLQWGDWGTNEDGETNLNIWDADNYNENVSNYTDETTEVLAFGLPSWGRLTLNTNAPDTAGDWGLVAGPDYGFGGGTWVGISSQSKNKDLAWEFVKFATLDEEHADWWITEMYPGDCVSNIAVMEAHADDALDFYGGQQAYKFWIEQSEGIQYDKVTEYDDAIGDAWGNAITKVKTDEATKDDAISQFYDEVAATYPNLTINR
ncbi:MAG: extracellular solute-binding protein [Acetatifactor sp.]|nr:extracellular solute-binding protein [Acetatifactor sp.]